MKINYILKYSKILSLYFAIFFINIVQCQTTTWNGSSWNNGDPDSTKDIFLTGNFTSVGDIFAKSISVSNDAVVTIQGALTPHTLTIENNVTVSGTLTKLIFENNASLVQINPNATNTGNIIFRRNATPMRQYEYTFWGSPVENQKLIDFSPLTTSNRFYTYNADPSVNNYVVENSNNNMLPGKAYAIMAPANYDATLQTYNGEFIGKPNNGTIPVAVNETTPFLLNYNFLSNPYPSAINTNNFLDSNLNLGALYFWTHKTAINNNVFTTDDYAIRSRYTSIAAISGGAPPGSSIAAGQGFFVSSSTNTIVNFTNTLRETGNNTQFYKNARNTQTDPLNYYIHLNFTNTLGAFKQIAIGYQELATNGYEFGTDAFGSTTGVVTFYSIIPPLTIGFAIQGRAFPWTNTDAVPLGFSTTEAGNYTIAIDHTNAFFDNKDIFIEDALTGNFFNLRSGSYNFSTATGTFNSRFTIKYQNLLAIKDTIFTIENSLNINANGNSIDVNSSNQQIKNIQVYSALGQLLFEAKNSNKNKITIENISKKNQTLIFKAEFQNGEIVTKKFIF